MVKDSSEVLSESHTANLLLFGAFSLDSKSYRKDETVQ